MKYNITFLLALIISIFVAQILAGPLIQPDTSGGFCHWGYDIVDDDGEAKSTCNAIVDFIDNDDGLGKVAMGLGVFSITYHETDGVQPKFPNGLKVKGLTADPAVFPDNEYATSRFVCALREGPDLFLTRDWNLDITVTDLGGGWKTVSYRQPCRTGILKL